MRAESGWISRLVGPGDQQSDRGHLEELEEQEKQEGPRGAQEQGQMGRRQSWQKQCENSTAVQDSYLGPLHYRELEIPRPSFAKALHQGLNIVIILAASGCLSLGSFIGKKKFTK